MYKKVIFRDWQELQAEDLNNIEAFTDEAISSLITDSISDRTHYTGFSVVQDSATEITVQPGRLYSGGKVYILEQPQQFNLFQYLPLTMKRIVTVAVWGTETETNVEPRDFLIDPAQNTTEPRAVAMQKVRLAVVNTVAGMESIDPQPSALPEGAIPVAHVYLTTTGIEKVVRVRDYELPRLRELKADVVELQSWRAITEPRIASIVTDLASLSKRSESKADLRQLLEIAADMARVKEKLNLPSTYQSYDADYFGNTDKIDLSGTTAKVKNGILFPDEAQALANLALFNPYDPSIQRFDNLILPKFDHVVKIKTEGYSGDISISQYQFQTLQVKKYTTYNYYWVYGWNWNWYYYWYYRYWYWHYGYYWWWYAYWYGYYGYWVRVPTTEYRLEETTQSINGAIVAQTFLTSSAFWLTALGLYFTQVDSNTDIKIVICETEHGKPVLQKALQVVTINPSDVKKYPEETFVPITPVFLKPGRYAICFITQGNYRVATCSGQNYLQGTLFFGTDGDYFTGDLTKDLIFKVYGAQFKIARTEVQLQPVSLAGGITDIAIDAPAIVPDGSSLTFEIQVGGKWYPITEVGKLSSKPDIVPIRAVFLGTGDVQPGLWLAQNAITASRPTTTFTALTKTRTLSSPRQNIDVQLLLHNFDPNSHTIDCVLIANNTTYTPALVKTQQEDQAIRRTFTFNISSGVSSYKIRISGTRQSSASPFAVVEKIDIAY